MHVLCYAVPCRAVPVPLAMIYRRMNGLRCNFTLTTHRRMTQKELQTTYSNYKNTLQQLASKIGDVEQEAEEHKFV